MRFSLVRLAGIIVIIIMAFGVVGFFIVRPVLAQVDATSTDANAASTVSPDSIDDASASATEEAAISEGSSPIVDQTATTSESAEVSLASAQPPAEVVPHEPAPEGLTEVHIIGTRYTDFFTDGTNEIAFPGDPAVDAHLTEQDAPTPTREGLIWVHTTGEFLYDTPSGELEIGDYALQPSGTYVAKPLPFVSSTSTPATGDTNASTSPAGDAPGPTASADATASTTSEQTTSFSTSTP